VTARIYNSSWCLLAALIGMMAAAQVSAAPPQAAPDGLLAGGGTSQPTPPHVEVERSLIAILERKAQVFNSIQTNDLDGLRTQLAQVRESLRQSRLQMDRALLIGAWSHKNEKRKAAHIIERMQEADILSLMGVAVASGYDYPTHKVPVAVADSTNRLFALLGDLVAEVTMFNREL
jgi:hypothetical protein